MNSTPDDTLAKHLYLTELNSRSHAPWLDVAHAARAFIAKERGENGLGSEEQMRTDIDYLARWFEAFSVVGPEMRSVRLHERCRVYAEVADLLRDVLDGEPDGDEQ